MDKPLPASSPEGRFFSGPDFQASAPSPATFGCGMSSSSLPATSIPTWPTDAAQLAESLAKAKAALARGELVAIPTETVYGLAGHALNESALARIFAVKKRPFFDPLIVHVLSYAQVELLAAEVPPKARLLMEAFWPGPLTVVLPRRSVVPDLATSGLPTVALRQPAHPVTLALLETCGFPLAAPSANPFGALSPTRAEHVASAFQEGIAGILDGGPCSVGVESTIVGFAQGEPFLLRAGGLPIEDLIRVAGPLSLDVGGPGNGSQSQEKSAPLAPGRLPWHYAPTTPLSLLGEPRPVGEREGRGLLSFRGLEMTRGYACVEVLSPAGDLHEASARLFACLHRLDARGLKGIDAESVPEMGLGLAIMDRLKKAAARPRLPLGHAET